MSWKKYTDPEKWDAAAISLSRSVDKVIDEQASGGSPVEAQRGNAQLKRLSDAWDLKFFSLGPAYVTVGIDTDILAEFAEATATRFDVRTCRFSMPVVAGLGPWSYILQGLPEEVFERFYVYMDGQRARREQEGEYWGFSGVRVRIPDPYGVQNCNLRPGEEDAVITVFCPGGLKTRWTATASNRQLPVTLIQRPPDPELLRESVAGLNKPISETEFQQWAQGGVFPVYREGPDGELRR